MDINKLQLISDIHLSLEKEWVAKNIIDHRGDAEVLIIAGDLAELGQTYDIIKFLNFLSPFYHRMIWVLGNHEYYSTKSVLDVIDKYLVLEYAVQGILFKDKFLEHSKDVEMIITHHLLHPVSIDPKYEGSKSNKYFLNDCSHIFPKCPKLKYHFHGHTHEKISKKVDGVSIVANPLGYLTEISKYDEFNYPCKLKELLP